MQLSNISSINPLQILQVVQSLLVYKAIFVLLLIGYILFHLIILAQIRSMNKIITQPISASILGFASLAQIALGIALLLFVIYIPI
ncbi:MAG TPA: DUF5657 family protein [Patescibacteria group bacterium]